MTSVSRDVITPVSRVVELFDGDVVGPNVGSVPRLGGGGYPEDMRGAAGRTVYYPGGSATLGELNTMVQNAGPMGIGQAGGGLLTSFGRSQRRKRKSIERRRRLTRRTSRRARRTQRQRKGRRAH
jgi:hypothetical protein